MHVSYIHTSKNIIIKSATFSRALHVLGCSDFLMYDVHVCHFRSPAILLCKQLSILYSKPPTDLIPLSLSFM